MKYQKILLISKYHSPWIGTPLIKNIENNFKKNVIFISPKKSEEGGFFSLLFYLFKIQINIISNIFKTNKILIYNDILLVIFTFPLLKIISYFKSIECYYFFESKWFSKFGDFALPVLRSCLNNKLYRKIFVLDNLLKEFLIFRGINSSNFVLLSTGIDFKLFKPQKKKFDFSLIYVGSLHKRRRIDMIIKAFKEVNSKYPQTNLKIVGGGPDLNNLKNLVKDLKLNNSIKFIGKIHQNKVSVQINRSDICITFYPPDIFDIQLPFKTLEYMACKKSVVSIETIATKRYFKNNENIILTKFNENSLAKSIILLIENPNLREKISLNGYNLSKQYNWKNVMNSLKENIK